MHRYRRARRPHDLLLQGQLQPLSGKAATAARRGGRPTRARREPLSQGARLDATATAGTRHESRSRIESFRELEERLRKRRESGNVRLDTKATYIGKKIFEISGLRKRFGDRIILNGLDYRFARYEKMGIIGDNGTGKSTFIRMLLGLEPPDAGTIDIGETVRFGYYAQQGLSFDENAKVIDVVSEIAEQIELGDGRRLSASQFLQHFLFPPQAQHDFVGKLSGGERRRLYLCTVLMRNPNFLVLDEPDERSGYRDAAGARRIPARIRRLPDRRLTRPLFHEQSRGSSAGIRRRRKDQRLSRELRRIPRMETAARRRAPDAARRGKRGRSRSRNGRPQRQAPPLVQRKARARALEKEIPELEARKAELEQSLCSGTLPIDELTRRSVEVSELIGRIDELSMRWLELSEIGE